MSSQSPIVCKVKVATVVACYMAAALVMVFVNKVVLNSTPELPFLFLFIQLVIAVLSLHTAAFIYNSPLGHNLPGKVDLPAFDLQVAMQLMPVVIMGVVGLVFNTLCLANVDASFFQIARGLALPITIAVSAIHTRNSPRVAVMFAAFIVTAGFFLGVSPASYFTSVRNAPKTTVISVVFGTLSSLTLSIHAVLVKSAYACVDNSVIKFTYWGNLLSALALVPGIILNGELGPAVKLLLSGGETSHVFLMGSAVTGVFGFLLSMATLLSIKVTSPVTHMFSSAARSVVQTMLGTWLFGDIVTSNRASSIFLITAGAIYYTWIKSSTLPSVSQQLDVDVEKGLIEKKSEVMT